MSDQAVGLENAWFDDRGNEGDFSVVSDRIMDLEDLLRACNVDTNVWKVSSYRVNKWETTLGGEITPLVQVKANLVRVAALEPTFPPIHAVYTQTEKPRQLRKSQLLKPRVVLIIPDTQHGFFYNEKGKLDTFHDPKALELSFEVNRRIKPDQIVFLGDHLDLPDWSDKYLASPECRGMTQMAIDSCGEFLTQHRLLAPKAQIDWLDSNHAKRMLNAVTKNLLAAYNLRPANSESLYPMLSEPYLLGFEQLGVNYHGGYPNEELWLNEELCCVHGSVAKNKSGATSQVNLHNLTHSLIQGHIHRQELLYRTSWKKNVPYTQFAGSPGTLARVDNAVPANKGRHNWQQGLFIVHVLNDKEFAVEPLLISQGKLFLRGSVIQA